jgi:hypothetical protein
VAVDAPVEVTPRRNSRLSGLGFALAFSLCLAGCPSLDRFDTPGTSAYCGSILGAPLFHAGFVPTGVRPSLELRLKLDTAALSTRPGTLTSNDLETGFCSADGHALFEEAPLRAIPELAHDTLSQLDFGEGHEQNFFAWVDSNCQGTMLAVVSMLTNGTIQVRLMKPAADPPPNAGPEQQPGFALFNMKRNDSGCGF